MEKKKGEGPGRKSPRRGKGNQSLSDGKGGGGKKKKVTSRCVIQGKEGGGTKRSIQIGLMEKGKGIAKIVHKTNGKKKK